MENAIYDRYALRTFVGIDFMKEQAPDATALLYFRHLLEAHHLKDNGGQDWERYIEQQQSPIRCKVEHPFRFVKVQGASERRCIVES